MKKNGYDFFMTYFAPIKAVQFMCTNKVRISTHFVNSLKECEGKITVQCKKESVDYEGSQVDLQSEGFRLVYETRLIPSLGIHNTGGTNVRFPTLRTIVLAKNGEKTVSVEKATVKFLFPERVLISLLNREREGQNFDQPIDRITIPLKGDCTTENFSDEEILSLQKGGDIQFPFEIEILLC